MIKILAAVYLLFSFTQSVAAQYKQDSLIHKKLIFNELKHTLLLFAPVIPKDLSAKNLPFFCDKEYKLERFTKIPFRFRLGSVEYCDKMEGKIK